MNRTTEKSILGILLSVVLILITFSAVSAQDSGWQGWRTNNNYIVCGGIYPACTNSLLGVNYFWTIPSQIQNNNRYGLICGDSQGPYGCLHWGSAGIGRNHPLSLGSYYLLIKNFVESENDEAFVAGIGNTFGENGRNGVDLGEGLKTCIYQETFQGSSNSKVWIRGFEGSFKSVQYRITDCIPDEGLVYCDSGELAVPSCPVQICTEGETRNPIFLNNYCNGLNVLSNSTYELCENNQWILVYNLSIVDSCNGGVILENQYCSENNLIQNWSQPICLSGACGRSLFSNSTICEFGCSNNQCNLPLDLFLNIISPQATIYQNNTRLVNLESNGTSIWYNWNGTNVSYLSPHYVSFNNGTNLLHAWANNSQGDLIYRNVTFFVNPTGYGESIEITVHSPTNNSVYSIPNILLNVSANTTASSWVYSLNNNIGMISLVPSDSFITLIENLTNGDYSLLVCGIINDSVGSCKTISFRVVLDGDHSTKKGKCTTCFKELTEGEDVIFTKNYTSSTEIISLSRDIESKETRDLIWLWAVLFFIAIIIILLIILRF